MRGTIRKALVCTAICTTALVGTAAGPAMAGEVTGNYTVDAEGNVLKGKLWIPKGASECSYSGQNDGYHEGTEAERVQSFGQIVRFVGPMGGVPGQACNPTVSPRP